MIGLRLVNERESGGPIACRSILLSTSTSLPQVMSRSNVNSTSERAIMEAMCFTVSGA